MRNEPEVTPALVADHGLTQEEYQKILEILGRTPSFTELGIFSVMWSEHCSYKHSRALLKNLPTTGECMLQGPGENAGAIDIGDEQAVVFKIESHNHPSAVEPFEGAATGVGGILRDIFTMGARPVAMIDPLRFGPLDNPRTKYLVKGVVSGISHYGNCVGVPTVAGEFMVEDGYQGNPLVNVMCVGLAEKSHLITSEAKGVGNPVYYFGSPTGRDGIHGATFASEELGDDVEDKRPSVQVGDPFTEKMILETTLELIASGCLVAIQDMGAAGLTCSTAEMASNGKMGIEIDLDKVPQRAKNMSAYEIMLSESQERMLAVCKKGQEDVLEAIVSKWELQPCKVGYLKEDGIMTVKWQGETVAQIPAAKLADEAPIIYKNGVEPPYFKEINSKSVDNEKLDSISLEDGIKTMLAHPNFSSKAWIYEQYDHMVQTNTMVAPGQDAAVLTIKDTDKALGISSDGNGYYCYLNPYEGSKIVVSQAARNLVAAGIKPMAATNCLNFGNPTKDHIYWQFEKVIEGMSEACTALNTPITGGNVSFYNETRNNDGKIEAIYPTPVMGVVGIRRDRSKVMTMNYKNAGDSIFVVGDIEENTGGSQYLKIVHELLQGPCPMIDMEKEVAVQDAVLEAINEELFASVHDLSEGGIMINVLESVFKADATIGVELNPECDIASPNAFYFSEFQSAFVVSVCKEKEDAFKKWFADKKISVTRLGCVTEDAAVKVAEDRFDRSKFEAIYTDSFRNSLKVIKKS